jgi:ATP-dependent DNA ligase
MFLKNPFEPARCEDLPPEDLSDLNYVGELKLDGSRYILYLGFDPYKRNMAKHTLLSRRLSKTDDKFVDRSRNIPHITMFDFPGMEGTVLDGEIMSSDFLATNSIMNSSPDRAVDKQKQHGNLDYHVFDILMLCGRDTTSMPYTERRKLLKDVVAYLKHPNIKIVQAVQGNLSKFFSEVVAKGGEGIVIKHVNGTYGRGWSKVKKAFDVSCVISGFKEGKGKYSAGQIGSIALSVYEEAGRLVEVGFASGFSDLLRKEISQNPQSFIGRVVDVFAQEMQSARLRHPTFHRLRDDIEPSACTLEKLKSDMTKNVKAGRVREE